MFGVEPMSKHRSVREGQNVLGFGRMVGGYIGIGGGNVGFTALFSETSQWELPCWPAVPDADRPSAVWADLGQSRFPNLHLEAVLYP